MKKNTVKATALAMLTGGAVLGGGCLFGNWQARLLDAAWYVGTEWLTDNDAVFDLFEDGEPTPATTDG